MLDDLLHVWPDGRSVQITRTCCAWEHPDKRGAHGMHVGGHHPHWLRVDGGAWQNVRASAYTLRVDVELIPAARSPDEWLSACAWELR